LQSNLNKNIEFSEREKLLIKIITTVRSTIDLDEMLTIICDEIGKAFNADRVSIIQCNNEEDYTDWFLKKEYIACESVKTHKQVNVDKEISFFWVEKLYKQGNKSYYIKNVPESKLPAILKSSYQRLEAKTMLGISIQKDEDKWGGLFLSKTVNFDLWTKEEIKLLEIISDQLFIAIKQAESYTTFKKQAERESLLRKIIQTIRSSLDINEIMDNLVTEVCKAFKADRCFIRLFNYIELSNNVIYKEYLSSFDVKSSLDYNYTNNFDKFVSELFLNNKMPIYPDTEILANNPDIIEDYKNYIKDMDVKSNYGIPIFVNDKFRGVIVIHYIKEKKELIDSDIKLLQMISNQTGIALKQAELYKTVQETAEKEKMLAEMMAVIKSNLKIDEIFLVICSLLVNLYNVNRIIISKLDMEENKLKILKECFKNNNNFKLSLKSKDYFYQKIIKNQTLIINDIKNADNPKYFLNDLELMNIKSFIMVPIYINKNETGAIIFQDDKVNNRSNEDIKFITRVADYISIAIKDSDFYNQSEFLSNAAHELKTPLSIINGYAEALLNLEKSDFEIVNKFAYIIKNNSKRLNKLIDNLLYISTIEKKMGQKNIVFEELKVIDLIKNSIQLCDEKIKLKNIKIEKNIKNIVIKRANTILLQQLIINLIINAVNYSEAGSTISLKATKKKKEVLISVEDRGCGIKKEHMSNIFERFYRVDKSRTRETGGTGLGLSISKLISEIHGGYIEVESIFGKGSIFTLHLPE